jgi:hypothetical protein
MMMNEFVNKWPKEWARDRQDEEFGRKLLEAMMPFVQKITEQGYTKKTVDRHLGNLFLLGDEIIREVSMDERYNEDAAEVLRESVEGGEGPLCGHLRTDAEHAAYDSTCRKLEKCLKETL